MRFGGERAINEFFGTAEQFGVSVAYEWLMLNDMRLRSLGKWGCDTYFKTEDFQILRIRGPVDDWRAAARFRR
jgi:hypothetical protein